MSQGAHPIAEAEALCSALRRLPPRVEQLLLLRFVDGATDAECAARYGIAADAWAVHLLRAARLFVTAAADPVGEPVLPRADDRNEETEREEARALVTALAATEPPEPATAANAAIVRPLLRLRARASEVRRVADERARAELESPRFKRNEWLRRGALLVLVAAALWLYFRTQGT